MTSQPTPVLIREMWPEIGFVVLFVALVSSWFLDAPRYVTIPLASAMLAIQVAGRFWRERSNLGPVRAVASAAGLLVQGALVFWLAIAVLLTVLVAIDGLRRENMILVSAAWAILGVLWLGERRLSRARGTS